MNPISLPIFQALLGRRSALIDLLEIYFSRGTIPDVALAFADRQVVWSSRVYMPVGHSKVATSANAQDRINDLTISCPDADARILAMLETIDLGGTPCLVRTISRGLGPASESSIVRYAGKIATTSVKGTVAQIQVESSTIDPDGQHVVPGRSYGTSCEYRFGGPACSVDIEAYTHRGAAANGSNRISVLDTSLNGDIAAQFPLPCVLRFDNGVLVGQERPVQIVSSGRIDLRKPFYVDPAVGDKFRIMRRCLKTPVACQGFNNWPNFGGMEGAPDQPRNLRRELG